MAAIGGRTALLLAVLAAAHVACVDGIRASQAITGQFSWQQHPSKRHQQDRPSFSTFRRLLAPSPENDSSKLSNFNSGALPVVQQLGPVQQNIVEPQAVQQLVVKQQQQPAPVQQQSVQQAAAPQQQPSPQPQPQVSSLQGGSCPDSAGALSAVNAIRARRGAGPLAWAPRLAQSAQAWVNNCILEHSNYAAQGVGETVMWGPVPGNCAAAVGAWAAEEGKWVPGSEPTNAFFGAGHFTQLVWKSTTEVGCGLNTCGGQFVVACHFAPPGNMPGAFSTNVG